MIQLFETPVFSSPEFNHFHLMIEDITRKFNEKNGQNISSILNKRI